MTPQANTAIWLPQEYSHQYLSQAFLKIARGLDLLQVNEAESCDYDT